MKRNKILTRLTHNIGLKIIALFFAILMWITVYNAEDPVKTKTIELNVTVTNAEYMSNQNKYFELQENSKRISIAVSAPRSILNTLDETDFTAIADISNITIHPDGKTGSVPVEVSCKRDSEDIKVSDGNRTCKVMVENMMSKQFLISAKAVGEILSGHALGEVEATTPTVLKVSGPESIVSQIASVEATIDVEGMSMNLTDNVMPVLLDSEGKEIDATRLTLSNPTVTVSAQILKTKTVPVIIETFGLPAEDHVATKLTSSFDKVMIKGSSSVLNSVKSIVIPTDVIDITGATESMTFDIDITEYLGNGVELMDKSQSSITVKVTVEQIKSKTYNVATESIQVVGLAENMELVFANETELFTFLAVQSNLIDLSPSDFTLRIDVSDLEEGVHSILVQIDVDEDIYSYAEKMIEIEIIPIPQDTESTEDSEMTEDTEVIE